MNPKPAAPPSPKTDPRGDPTRGCAPGRRERDRQRHGREPRRQGGQREARRPAAARSWTTSRCRACSTRASCTRPHAHARIVRIDAAQARAMPGVACVLTHEDVPRVPLHDRGPGLARAVALRRGDARPKVRFVGDRVAVVAAEDPELAARGRARRSRSSTSSLPARLRPRARRWTPGAPVIHDQPDSSGHQGRHAQPGRRDRWPRWATSRRASPRGDSVFEHTYRVPYVQQSSIEPHITITWLDEDHRLMVRTSTQVPFHVRRIIAPAARHPVRRIRVIKPRIGGGFGGKQEILIEDLCGMLTLRTRPAGAARVHARGGARPARTRHPQIRIRQERRRRTALHAPSSMKVLENTGAYGTHALTVMSVTGNRALSALPLPEPALRGHAPSTRTWRWRAPSAATAARRASSRWRATWTRWRTRWADPLEFRTRTTCRRATTSRSRRCWARARRASSR